MFSGLFTSHALDRRVSPNDNGRDNILEIPVDDAVVVQVLHAGQDGTETHQSLVAITG